MKKIFFTVLFTLLLSICCYCSEKDIIDEIENNTDYSSIRNGSIGGEWLALALCEYDSDNIKALNEYKKATISLIKEKHGILSNRKNTEYSRTIIALSALGCECGNIEGYDLYSPIEDFDKTVSQGLNGAIFALIAFNKGNRHPVVEEKYVSFLLDSQKPDGGFGLSDISEPDVTAMAIQALSAYYNDPAVKAATDRALNYLSGIQLDNGGFSAYGSETSEYASQAIIALTSLNIPIDDSRFVKNGNTLYDALLYYKTDKGFSHVNDGTYNQLATEQALCALVSLYNTKNGKGYIYSDNRKSAELEELICLSAQIDCISYLFA